MTRVCVIFGGGGRESEVSFNSSRSIIKSLKKLGYDVCELNFGPDFISEIAQIKPDVVFNAMHGTWGEDGVLQTLLDFLKIPYTHSGRESCVIGMNKIFAKEIAKSLGIPVLESKIYSKEQILKGEFKVLQKSFLKPNSEGSTIGCFCIEKDAVLSTNDLEVIRLTNSSFFILEEFFDGVEVSIAILGNRAIGGVEIRPKSGYYDYVAKYTNGKTDYFIPPNISKTSLQKMEEGTLKFYQSSNMRGIARADFLIKGEDFRFLEINTHPGFTDLSLVPQIANSIGISFEDIIKFLVENATFEAYSK